MTRNLEKIAGITNHIREVLENTDPRETWQQVHGLTLMIDGLLIAEGLDVKFPDYGLEKALDNPQYEVNRRIDETLDERAIIDELYEVYGLDAEDIGVLGDAYRFNSVNDILETISEKSQDPKFSVNEWVKEAYQIMGFHEGVEPIKPEEEDSKEIEAIIKNVD